MGNNTNVHIESTALVLKGSNSTGPNPNSNFSGFNYFGSFGFSRGKNSRGKDRPICIDCRVLSHIMDNCFKSHGFPLRFKNKGKTSMVNQMGIQDDFAEKVQSSIQYCCSFSFYWEIKSNIAILDYAGKSNASWCSI